MTRRRADPAIRRQEILDAAIKIAKVYGYLYMRRNDVAEEARASTGLISHYFVSMDGLKTAVLEAALEKEIVPILAQALSMGDITTQSLTPALKKKIKMFFD